MISLSKVIEEYNNHLHNCGFSIPIPLVFGSTYNGSARMDKLNLNSYERLYYVNRRGNRWVVIGSINLTQRVVSINPNELGHRVLILESESKRNKRIRDLMANPTLEIFDYLREKDIMPCVTYYNIHGTRKPNYKYVINT